MPRLFVALEIPEELRPALSALRRGIPGARWVPDEQFHLTLAFVGEVEGPVATAARDGLNGVRADPFELELSGVGRFPPRGRARVLWAGLRETDEVAALADAVRRCLSRRGVPTESRRFAPHVTLARLNGATDRDVTAPAEAHPARQKGVCRSQRSHHQRGNAERNYHLLLRCRRGRV